MAKEKKYRVVDESHPKFGKKIKAIPNDLFQFVDVKSGEVYEQEQLMYIPDAHALYFGVHIKRVGFFIFAREYWRYRSYQFGLSVDVIAPKDGNNYLDFELRVAFLGIGIRFVKLANFETKCEE